MEAPRANNITLHHTIKAANITIFTSSTVTIIIHIHTNTMFFVYRCFYTMP